MNRKKEIAIPIQIMNMVIVKGNFDELRIYFFLKQETSGHFLITKSSITIFCKKLEINSKTFYNYLSKFLIRKWITYNKKRKSYRVISTRQLCRKLNLKSKKMALYSNPTFQRLEFKAFVCGASIIYFAENLMRHETKIMKKNGVSIESPIYLNRYLCNLGSTRMNSKRGLYTPPYLILPTKYYAKIINKNQSTASRYKKLAIKFDFIEVEKVFKDMEYLSPRDAYIISKRKDFNGFLKIQNKKVQIQLADKIISKIQIIQSKRLLK